MKTIDEKFQTVINKNTFYFFDKEFEEEYEGHINSLKETLLVLKNDIEIQGLRKEVFENLVANKENGLRALLALTGVSNEMLKRIITLIRIVDDKELNELVNKNCWDKDTQNEQIAEWSDNKIQKEIENNEGFRKGLINIFFEGASIPFFASTLPLFELKKLSISKLGFNLTDMVDTLVRYKEKGSYSGKKKNNPETVIENLLCQLEIGYEKGDLSELIDNVPDQKRTMDFIIPDKDNPIIIMESSYLVTTSSGQGDKSKTEISIDQLIKSHYPNAKFFGFIDGIGWYVRKGDLRRMVTAYEDVFTFHDDEISRFKSILTRNINNVG